MSGQVVSELFTIGVLILINSLFVAAEIALVTVRRSRLQQMIEEGDRGARRVARLIADPSRFLAVIQIGITFIGFLAAAYAGANLAVALQPVIAGVQPLADQAEVIALLIVTALVSLVTIVFGELVPKRLALAHAERYAMLVSRPVILLGKIMAPLVWMLTLVTNATTRLLGVREVDEDRLTSEEIRILVERGGEQGVIEAEEEQMIGAVLELGKRRVHEVMVPRIDIAALAADAPLDELVDTIVREGHSRIPVYEETIDNVIGILYAKDLLPYLKGVDHPPPTRTLLRTPLFVPESMTIDDLLHSLQRRKVHIAIVLDEYGGTAGLVTIEDLIEEIVGEIQDEYDVEEPMIEPLGDDQARIDGRASVDDLMEHFDVTFNGSDHEEYDTVGGLVYHHIGGVPKVGDTVEVNGTLTLTVESTDGRRVGKVMAVRRRRDDATDDGDD
ncbi:MAG: HlyC/CorC family transporter [Chloroflexi bacterium]|nr:HlyC/CorC family transporter [Chloroflexota bacterium]